MNLNSVVRHRRPDTREGDLSGSAQEKRRYKHLFVPASETFTLQKGVSGSMNAINLHHVDSLESYHDN